MDRFLTKHAQLAEVALVFVAFWMIFITTASYDLRHTDGIVRYLVAGNIADHGDVILREAEEGEVNAGLWGVTGRDGRLYSFYGFGHSVLILPTYYLSDAAQAIFGSRPNQYIPDMNLFFLGQLAPFLAALLGASVYSTLRDVRFSKKVAFGTAAVICFASLVWPHARTIHDNFVETALVMVTLALIVASHAHDNRWFIPAAGAVYGLAFATRTSAAFAFPALMTMLLLPDWVAHRDIKKSLMRVVWFGLGSLTTAWLFAYYNYARFGDFLDTGYGQMFERDSPAPGQPLLPGLRIRVLSLWDGLLPYTPTLLIIPFVGKAFANGALDRQVLLWGGIVTQTLVTVFYATFRGLGAWSYGPGYVMLGVPWLLLIVAGLFGAWRQHAVGVRVLGVSLILLNFIIMLPGVIVSYDYAPLKAGEYGYSHSNFHNVPPRYSVAALVGQQAVENIRHVATGATFDPIPDTSTWLDTYLGFNIPDWWWLHAAYRGFAPALVIPVVLLTISGVSVWLLFRSEPPRHQMPDDAHR